MEQTLGDLKRKGWDGIREYLEVRLEDNSANKIDEDDEKEVFYFDSSFYVRSKSNQNLVGTALNLDDAVLMMKWLLSKAALNPETCDATDAAKRD